MRKEEYVEEVRDNRDKGYFEGVRVERDGWDGEQRN